MYVRPALLLATVVALSGCGSTTATTAEPSTVPATTQAAAAGLTITDPWVKTAKKGMTAAFGTLVNNTDTELTVTAGTSPLSSTIELHEVVDSGANMIMRPKDGGFVIPARGTHELRPGGDHLMLMGVTEEVKPGEAIPFTLTVKGGEPLKFTAIGKDFAGGEEDYQPGMEH